MRRVIGFVGLALGVVLIVGAALIRWVAAPALVKAPLDIDRTTVATGNSQVFVLTDQAVRSLDVVATRTVVGDRKAGTGSVAVYDETLCLVTASTQNRDRLGCVGSTDPGFIQKTTDRVAFDRVSALAVSEAGSFGANVDGNKSVAHDGLGYTFPIDTSRQSYPFFDTVVGRAYPMRFVDSEKLAGLTTYRFVQDVPSSAIKINGILPGTYTNTRTVWVEPTTGVIVKGSEQIDERFTSGNGVVFAGTLTFTDATVTSQAAFAKDQRNKIHIIRLYAPVGVAVVGVVLVLIGGALARRRTRRAVADSTQ